MGQDASTPVETKGLEENIKEVLKARKEKMAVEEEDELDPELIYDGEYTELKISKNVLKWRVARINSTLGTSSYIIYSK